MPEALKIARSQKSRLQSPRMNLGRVAVDDYVEDSLTGNHPVGRVVDVPVRADYGNAKVAHSIGVGYRSGIGQYDKWNISAYD